MVGASGVVRQWLEALNRHDMAAVGACYAEDCVFTAPTRVTRQGRESVRQYWHYTLLLYPDLHVALKREVAAGATVCQEVEATGTNAGPTLAVTDGAQIAPATGKRATLQGVVVSDVAGGQITVQHLYFGQFR
jgi:steroid delta-isomerase-like uncharacterized protein